MVTLTKEAAARVRELAGQTPERGLRICVTRGGCAGFSYSMKLEDRPADADTVFESNDVRVFIDPRSLPLVDGSEVDYVDNVERTGFALNNPNVVSACGCGSSFQTKKP